MWTSRRKEKRRIEEVKRWLVKTISDEDCGRGEKIERVRER